MSHATVTEEFADATYEFCLRLGEWEEIQEKTKLGPEQLFWKFYRREYLAEWPRLVIRLGLIGAGMKAIEARRLVERYVDTRPFSESWPLAFRIVAAACFVPDEADAKKNETPDAVAMGESSSRSSSATVQ